jgi:hypothetical protein
MPRRTRPKSGSGIGRTTPGAQAHGQDVAGGLGPGSRTGRVPVPSEGAMISCREIGQGASRRHGARGRPRGRMSSERKPGGLGVRVPSCVSSWAESASRGSRRRRRSLGRDGPSGAGSGGGGPRAGFSTGPPAGPLGLPWPHPRGGSRRGVWPCPPGCRVALGRAMARAVAVGAASSTAPLPGRDRVASSTRTSASFRGCGRTGPPRGCPHCVERISASWLARSAHSHHARGHGQEQGGRGMALAFMPRLRGFGESPRRWPRTG